MTSVLPLLRTSFLDSCSNWCIPLRLCWTSLSLDDLEACVLSVDLFVVSPLLPLPDPSCNSRIICWESCAITRTPSARIFPCWSSPRTCCSIPVTATSRSSFSKTHHWCQNTETAHLCGPAVFMCRLLPHNFIFSVLGDDRLHVPDCAISLTFYKRDHIVDTDTFGTAWERVMRSQRLAHTSGKRKEVVWKLTGQSTCASHTSIHHWHWHLSVCTGYSSYAPFGPSRCRPLLPLHRQTGLGGEVYSSHNSLTQEMWISSHVAVIASSRPLHGRLGPAWVEQKSKTHMASRVRISFQRQSREPLSGPNLPFPLTVGNVVHFAHHVRPPRGLGPKIGDARSPYHTMTSDISSTKMLFVPIAQIWILTTSAVSSKLPICEKCSELELDLPHFHHRQPPSATCHTHSTRFSMMVTFLGHNSIFLSKNWDPIGQIKIPQRYRWRNLWNNAPASTLHMHCAARYVWTCSTWGIVAGTILAIARQTRPVETTCCTIKIDDLLRNATSQADVDVP